MTLSELEIQAVIISNRIINQDLGSTQQTIVDLAKRFAISQVERMNLQDVDSDNIRVYGGYALAQMRLSVLKQSIIDELV